MSIRLMARVWEVKVTRTQQSILLAMADHANDEGRHCYPSVAYLAWKTDYSERQVQRTLSDLRKLGILEVTRQATRYQPTEYRILLDRAEPKEPYRGDTDDAPGAGRGDTHVVPGVTPVTGRGDTGVVSGATSMSPKPPIEPPIEPPMEPREGASAPPTPAAAPQVVRSEQPANGTLRHKSRHLDARDFVGGYIPAGTGRNPVQVYYERFCINADAERLNTIQEDDLARLCPDLDRLRQVVIEYSRRNYRPGRIDIILEWYNGRGSYSPRKERSNGTHQSSQDHGYDPGRLSPEEERDAREAARRMAQARAAAKVR